MVELMTCFEKYAWISVVVYLSAIYAYVATLKDPYGIIGWTLATSYSFAYAWAIRHERHHGAGSSCIRAYPMPNVLMAAVVVPFGFCVWCLVHAVRLGEDLSPPYDTNHYLGAIPANVASIWAFRFARWARREPTVELGGKDDRTTRLLEGV